MCPSGEENTVPMRHLVFLTLYRWLSGMQGGIHSALHTCNASCEGGPGHCDVSGVGSPEFCTVLGKDGPEHCNVSGEGGPEHCDISGEGGPDIVMFQVRVVQTL